MTVCRKLLGPLSSSFHKWKLVPALQQKKASQKRAAERLLVKWRNMSLDKSFVAWFQDVLQAKDARDIAGKGLLDSSRQ